MKDIIADNIALILSTLFGGTSFVGWISEKNKRREDSMTSMQILYKKFTEDMGTKYNELSAEVSDLKGKLVSVTRELEEEKNKYIKLKQSYDSLKREFESYKRNNTNI